jgi:hypothetical protein
MSYLILRGRWCDAIVLNIHALTEDKLDHMKGSFCEELARIFLKFPKYHMRMLSDFNAKVGREDIFEPGSGN